VIDYTKSSIELISESDFRQRIKDAIKVSDMLSHNPDLIVLSVSEAEKIIKILDGTDDLKQAVKEAKSNRSSVVVANKRYKNVLSEIDND
jgi:dsDNA-specific endonuclease/ATPase MutS2